MNPRSRPWHRDPSGNECYATERFASGPAGWETCAKCGQKMPVGFANLPEPDLAAKPDTGI